MPRNRPFQLLTLLAVLVLLLSACGGSGKEAPASASEAPPSQEKVEEQEAGKQEAGEQEAEKQADEEHQEGDEHAADEHAAKESPDGHQEGEEAVTPHEEGDDHPPESEEHGGGAMAHGVPEEALALENPIPATPESIAIGAQIFAERCVACHGEEGRGDGPAAASLDPPPSNLHAEHVHAQTDGSMFWTIKEGSPGTAMPAWGDVLTEEEIWHLVNFIHTFDDSKKQ